MAISHVRWVSSGSRDDDAVLAYAGRQLAAYVRKLSGQRWDVRRASRLGGAAAGEFRLGLADRLPAPPGVTPLQPAPWDDGFAIWADGDSAYIAGRNARSVLFGVYAFLESLGVRFLRPGRKGEVLPRLEAIALPASPIVEQAEYRHRGLCIEGAVSLEHCLGTIDWCAKKRLNTVFLQFFSSRYFYNQWYERAYNPKYAQPGLTDEQALAYDDRLIAAMKQRGLIFHRVGHSWTSAAFDMPRSGWVKASSDEIKPEFRRFPALVNGERKLFGDVPINTELCYSYQPAFDRFVNNVVTYVEQHPELDVVHVWLSDAVNNKCECEECRRLSISDWYAKVINALSQKLHERAPGKRFVFLCYFELLWAPQEVAIDDQYGNAIMMFAPISRCYGHSLFDPSCGSEEPDARPALNQFVQPTGNAFLVRRLADWRRAFQGDSFDFDYHLMWAIWRQNTDTALARVYHEDLQQLKEHGLNGIISCQSFRAFYPSGLAMATLADALWNPSQPFEELRGRYLLDAYGSDAAFADEYLSRVEGYLDTGDEHKRTVPFANASAAQLDECAAFLRQSEEELSRRSQAAADPAQALSLELLAHHAYLLQYLVAAHQARLVGSQARAERQVERATAFLQRTEARYSPFLDTMLAINWSVKPHAW